MPDAGNKQRRVQPASNRIAPRVYRAVMRSRIFLYLLLIATTAKAQPRPELSVVFVDDAHGRPMRGTCATPIAAQAWLSKPGAPAWTVEMHFTVRDDYPYSPHEIGKRMFWPLNADTIRDGRHRHLRFSILDGYCTDQYLRVIRGDDTMRVDMPNDPTARGHLQLFMVKRSGALSSPEVIRFRPGRFSFVTLAQEERMNELEMRLAGRLLRDTEKKSGQRRSREQTHTADPVVAEKQKVVRKVELHELLGDTAVLRFWGNVMLTGACGGIMPLMAVEVVGDRGWEDHVPMPDAQMDCGPLSEEGNGHELRIPLAEWMQAHGRSAMPGRYRLKFRFADGAVRWTRAFELK